MAVVVKCPESSLKEPLITPSGREVAHWNEQFEWHRRVVAGRRSCSWFGMRSCSLDAVLTRVSPSFAPFFAGETYYIFGHRQEHSEATVLTKSWCVCRSNFLLYSVRLPPAEGVRTALPRQDQGAAVRTRGSGMRRPCRGRELAKSLAPTGSGSAVLCEPIRLSGLCVPRPKPRAQSIWWLAIRLVIATWSP
jgi:hypothetical protein